MKPFDEILIASGNAHKIEEIRAVLPEEFRLVSQSDYAIPSPPETGLTFVENAIIKARNASTATGLPSIADDSGLEVDYLNGEPGIYSSRYAGTNASDADNNEKLLSKLAGVARTDRTARFQCVIVFMRHASDPMPLIATGTWEGFINEAPRGNNGFGYDPLFGIPGAGKTAAELTSALKNAISHRALALAQLKLLMRA